MRKKKLEKLLEREARYAASVGAPFSDKDAPAIGAEVEAITASGALVTPVVIVERATPEDAPLHNHFEWNDTVAAARFRERQAMNLLNHLEIVFTAQDGTQTREKAIFNVAFRAVDDEGNKGNKGEVQRAYVPSSVARVDFREQLVRRYMQELQTWLRRVQELELTTDFQPVVDASLLIAK